MKKCWLCGENMIEKVDDIEFNINNKIKVLKNIRHSVCTNCEEITFDRETSKDMQKILK